LAIQLIFKKSYKEDLVRLFFEAEFFESGTFDFINIGFRHG